MIRKSDFNPECITPNQMKIIFNARMYYRRLTAWARAYILSRYLAVGTADELFGLLYLEALDQADSMKLVFGREDSDKYTELLADFVILLRDIISAQLNGDEDAIERDSNRIAQNIERRAAYLHELNPYWSEEEYKEQLGTYIQYLLDLANLMATGDYERDIEVYDHLTTQSHRLGDIFAEGIYNFITSGAGDAEETEPGEGRQCISYDEINIIFGTKMFWFELAVWTRNYMLSRFIGFGDSDRVFNHLRHTADDFISLVRQIFGDEIAEAYARSFEEYIELIDAFVTAQMEGDTERVDEIVSLLYQNTYARASIITSGNPYWEEDVWRQLMLTSLRRTIDESTAFLTGDYPRSLDIFNTLLVEAESMGNEFERGFFNYISSSPSLTIISGD